MAHEVRIKPGPPWGPARGTTGSVAPDVADAKVRTQLRWSVAFLGLILAGFAFSIIFNFAQASRTGAGSGFGDTILPTPHEAKTFFETHNVPDSNH